MLMRRSVLCARPDLAARATEVDLGGAAFQIVSLDDLIRMKQAAGRPKDRIELEVLYALRDEAKEAD
jgi:predicted nucleotidyltransferase